MVFKLRSWAKAPAYGNYSTLRERFSPECSGKRDQLPKTNPARKIKPNP